MSGSSVAAMVVGTVFIMVFGLATVSLVESVDESIKNAEFTLPDPQVVLTTVTDKEETTGPVEGLVIADDGLSYTGGDTCTVSGSAGTGLSFTISVDGTGQVTGISSITVLGSGYTDGETVNLNCNAGTSTEVATVTIDIHSQNKITIKNTGSETVDLDHIFITLSNTVDETQGTPFKFTSEYSGSNLFLFPGEELSTDAFPLDSTEQGFAIGDDPNRAFLAIYDYNDAISVTIT